jgi:sulfate permease, SulP family
VAVAAGGDPARALVAASTLAVLAGALLLLAGLRQLGFLADFISAPVLAGFKAGTGPLIAAGQLGKVLGVPQEGDSFFRKVGSALSHLGEISWPTAVPGGGQHRHPVGVAALGAAVAAGPAARGRLGILLAVVTGLADRGVALVGTIPPGLPEFAAPDLAMVQGLLPAAAASP